VREGLRAENRVLKGPGEEVFLGGAASHPSPPARRFGGAVSSQAGSGRSPGNGRGFSAILTARMAFLNTE